MIIANELDQYYVVRLVIRPGRVRNVIVYRAWMDNFVFFFFVGKCLPCGECWAGACVFCECLVSKLSVLGEGMGRFVCMMSTYSKCLVSVLCLVW